MRQIRGMPAGDRDVGPTVRQYISDGSGERDRERGISLSLGRMSSASTVASDGLTIRSFGHDFHVAFHTSLISG
jgi:hypothetical protein